MLKLSKIRVPFNHVLTTKDLYERDVYEDGMIVKTAGSVKEYQKVITVGNTVSVCKAGDTIIIDPKRYAVMQHKDGENWNGVVKDNPVVGYSIPEVTLNGKNCLLIYDTDVQLILDEYEEDFGAPDIYVAPEPVILQ